MEYTEKFLHWYGKVCDDPTVPIVKFNTNVYEESENNRIENNDVIKEKNMDRLEGCTYTH